MRCAPLFLAALAILSVACGTSQSRPGSAHFQVIAAGDLTLAERVTNVTITLTAPDLQPTTFALTKVGSGAFTGTLNSIRAGQERRFSAIATDIDNVPLFSGVSAPTTIQPGATAQVHILLQVLASQNPGGSSPIIDSITLSSDDVTPGTLIAIAAVAHDPIPAQTATLTYAWTQPSGVPGTFDAPAAASGNWMSPGGVTTPVTTTLMLTVTNAQQRSASISVTVTTELAPYSGGAAVDVAFGPVVTSINAVPAYLFAGTPTQLTANATDGVTPSDLTYAWVSTCTHGTFEPSTAAVVLYTPSALDPDSCMFTVTATGPTGSGTGSLTLGLAPSNPIHILPQIDAVTSSVPYILGPTAVTLRAFAHSGSGSPLTFHWVHSSGEFINQVDTQGNLATPESTSTITWNTGGCTQSALIADVEATDADGNVTNAGVSVEQKCDPVWPMAGHDAQRTSRSPAVGPQTLATIANGRLHHFQFSADVTSITCSVIGGDGIVYSQLRSTQIASQVASGGTTISAFDPATGVEKWRFATPPSLAAEGPYQELGCPVLDATGYVYADRSVYNGANPNPPSGYTESLIAIDEVTGTLAWKLTLGPLDASSLSTLLVGTDNTVYVPSVGGRKLYAVRTNDTNRSSGALVWTYTSDASVTNHQNLSALSNSGETLYITTAEGEGGLAAEGSNPDSLYALNTVDGTLFNARVLTTPVGSAWESLTIAPSDELYAIAAYRDPNFQQRSIVSALPPINSVTPWAPDWSLTFNGFFYQWPAIAADGTFYASTFNSTSNIGYLRKITQAGGAVDVLTQPGFRAGSLPILDAAGNFYQVLINSNNDGGASLVGANHTAQLWTLMAGLECAPSAMAADGTLVVPCAQPNGASLNFILP